MSSPQLPEWDTPQYIPQSADPTSSPAISFISKTFSTRYSSPTSTLASSPSLRESFEGFGTGKSTLHEVREEPVSVEYDETPRSNAGGFVAQSKQDRDQFEYSSYDFDVSPHQGGDGLYPQSKKARSGDSSVASVAPKVGRRINSLSKKWKTRTGAGPKLSIDVVSSQPNRSRQSSAESSLTSPAISAISKHENHLPPSPAQTLFEENIHESPVSAIDIDKANAWQEEDTTQARTPLLPPMLMSLAKQQESPVQSPLQSPTIAESPLFPESTTPADTPQLSCLPSPPLSTKPSIASLRQRSRAGTMIPSADIPPMIMDDEEDPWSAKLGHANFTVHPEPYLPGSTDWAACKQFCEDYEQARASYSKHLARTGENSGNTSRVYNLTEEKWAEVEAQWKQYNAIVAGRLEHFAKQDAAMANMTQSSTESSSIPQIPSNDIVTGKFPVLGDEDIVGPMSVAPALRYFISNDQQSRINKKRTFFKFISDLLTRGNVRP